LYRSPDQKRASKIFNLIITIQMSLVTFASLLSVKIIVFVSGSIRYFSIVKRFFYNVKIGKNNYMTKNMSPPRVVKKLLKFIHITFENIAQNTGIFFYTNHILHQIFAFLYQIFCIFLNQIFYTNFFTPNFLHLIFYTKFFTPIFYN